MSLDVQLTAAERKKLRMKEWRAANRDRLREYNRAWLEQNKASNAEKAANRSARYYDRSKDAILARKRERYAALDRGQRQAYSGYAKAEPGVWDARRKGWKAANPGAVNAQTARRRAQLLQATPAWADAATIRGIYEMAEVLGRLSGTPMNVDHIIPLCGRNVCGLHVENNLRVLTAEANRRKGAHHVG